MAKNSLLKGSPQELARKYYRWLNAAGIPVEQIIIFGSQASGSAGLNSDLDLCVVSKDFGKAPFDEMVKLAKLAITIDPMIEPHPYHPKDLQSKWDSLASEIRRHGIVVYP